MARYVSLIRFTDQGARALKKSAARALGFRKAAEKAGIAVEAQLWTAGSSDGLLILSGVSLVAAQDEKTAYEGEFIAPEFPAQPSIPPTRFSLYQFVPHPKSN